MADFPTGAIPVGIGVDYEEEYLRPSHRTTMDDGFEKTRAKWARTRRQYMLTYKGLTRTQADAVVTFFEDGDREFGAGQFTWDHPFRGSGAGGTDITVRLVDDSLKFTYVGENQSSGDLYNATMIFREV